MTSSELTEWQAEFLLRPFGENVEDLRAGLAASVAVNLNRTKNAAAVGPMDFYPWQEKSKAEPVAVSPEELARQIKTKIFGAN